MDLYEILDELKKDGQVTTYALEEILEYLVSHSEDQVKNILMPIPDQEKLLV